MITHLISLNENLSAQPFFNVTHLNIYISIFYGRKIVSVAFGLILSH